MSAQTSGFAIYVRFQIKKSMSNFHPPEDRDPELQVDETLN